MKKILLLLLSVLVASILSFVFAEDGNSNNGQNTGIMLKIYKVKEKVKPHRAPMKIDLVGLYDEDTHNLSIVYDGEAEGEVFVYLGDSLVGYSNEINSTIVIPGTPGAYSVEIITESWTALGAIEL